MWRKTKIITMIAAAFMLWIGASVSAQAVPLSSSTSRIYGESQIDTAVAVSRQGWAKADTVLIANAYQFPDALVASPLSHKLDAPVLLNSAGQLDPQVLEEIKRLGAKKVILLGGEAVLKPEVKETLDKDGYETERIWGTDAYETAARVAARVGFKGDVIIVNGEQFPDALSISAYAGMTETPILLTGSKSMPEITQRVLAEAQAQAMEKEGAATALVIGGEAVVPSSTLEKVIGLKRIAGFDRYETASKVYFYTQSMVKDACIGYVVTGEQFPDALVAGALAAKQGAGLFMAEKNTLPPNTYSAMGNASDVGSFHAILIGGPAVLTDEVAKMIEGTAVPKYLLAGVTIVVDPGHGGKDTGAIGATGIYEKNNTLPTGLYLTDLLRAAGAKVIMTRTDDAPPTGDKYTEAADLKARTEIANSNKADIFISIHNDSFTNDTAGGTTTYYSSGGGAKEESIALGKIVQAEVVKELGLRDRGVKDSNFYVVKYTTMTSVLVELGFISNPDEEALLAAPEGQKKAAQGIYRAILIYKGW